MRYFNLFVPAALLMLGACAQDTLTGVSDDGIDVNVATVSKDEVKMVPVKGTFSGYGWLDDRPGCPAGSVPIKGLGSGNSTLLGEFEVRLSTCSFGAWSVGKDTLIAANGDMVYTDITIYYTSPVDYNTEEIITGGTGRFENATGTVRAYGVVGPPPPGYPDVPWMEATFEGEVSSVGSSN